MSEPVVAIIVAAGLGTRFGGQTPKQFLRLTGRAVVTVAVEAMAAGGCTHVVVVINEKASEHWSDSGSPIPVFTTFGGSSRQESVRKGIEFVHDHPELRNARVVLIHDAVRPMVPAHVVHSVVKAVDEGAAAVAPYVPVTDTIRRVREDGHGSEVLDRSQLRSIQTPQGFPLDVIVRAHREMADRDVPFTDDVSCVEALGHEVVLVEGSRLAMKITEPTDLTVAKALWKVRRTIGHHSGRRVFRLGRR